MKLEDGLKSFLVILHNAAERITGIPVEYVSFTVKLQDRPPISATRRSGIYDRQLPDRHGREDDDRLDWEWREEWEEAGRAGDDHGGGRPADCGWDVAEGRQGAA